MSKAEEKAKEYAEKFILTVDHQSDVEEAYYDGYHQAEKDLELTWKDIEKITDIWDDLHEDETVYIKTGYDTPEFYKEILKQFKNYKEKEEREEK
jgi:hypothetical protein